MVLVLPRPATSGLVFVAGAICSIIPDLDVVGLRFGIHYGDSKVIAVALIACCSRRCWPYSVFFSSSAMTPALTRHIPVLAYLFVATASHDCLDAMTDGGLGVAFFSPFDDWRYFLPWRPIHVSPIGVARLFSQRGLTVLQSELLWIWLPFWRVCADRLALPAPPQSSAPRAM